MENTQSNQEYNQDQNVKKNFNQGKDIKGNPDVNFGADVAHGEGGDTEINTGSLGDQKEVDLDRSGVNTESGSDDSSQQLSGEEGSEDFEKGKSFRPEGYDKSGSSSDSASSGI